MAATAGRAGATRLGHGMALGSFHEGVVALDLLVAHEQETRDDDEPVKVVRDDRAVGGCVVPSQDGVEDAPTTATVVLGRAALCGEC